MKIYNKIYSFVKTNNKPFIIFFFHAFIVLLFLSGGDIENKLKISSDTHSYQIPAQNIIDNGFFSRESETPFIWEPYRTPGLPLLVVISLLLFKSSILILFMNTLMAGISFYYIERIIDHLQLGKFVNIICAFLFMLMPNALGLNGMVLTDALCGYFYILFLYSLYDIATKQILKKNIFLLFFISISSLQLLKPTYSVLVYILIICSIFVHYFAHQKINIIRLLKMFIISLFIPIILSSINYKNNKVFTVSLLSQDVISNCLLANHISWKEGTSFLQARKDILYKDKEESDFFEAGSLKYYRLYNYQKKNNIKQFKNDPLGVFFSYTRSVIKSFLAPQEMVYHLFYYQHIWTRAVGSILQIGFLIMGLSGFYLMFKNNHKAFVIISMILILFIYAASGLSYANAPRLRFPADMLLIIPAGFSISFYIKKHLLRY